MFVLFYRAGDCLLEIEGKNILGLEIQDVAFLISRSDQMSLSIWRRPSISSTQNNHGSNSNDEDPVGYTNEFLWMRYLKKSPSVQMPPEFKIYVLEKTFFRIFLINTVFLLKNLSPFTTLIFNFLSNWFF